MSKTPQDPEELSAERRLRKFISEARRNHGTLQRFQASELQLMSCVSLREFLDMLLRESRARLGWDLVTLNLTDVDGAIQSVLEYGAEQPETPPGLNLLANDQSLRELFGTERKPLLGSFQVRQHAALFDPGDPRPTSVGLVPISRAGRLFGSLNLGSYNRERYQPDNATDFLDHLTAVISLCLEMIIAREKLKILGLTDPLTGINNRRFFDQRLPEEVARAIRHGTSISCLMADVDHFKAINDAHGHPFGDQVLKTIASLIREQLRQIDVVARVGGEAFAAILGGTSNDRAVEVANRIRTKVENTEFLTPNQEPLSATLSIGISSLPPGTKMNPSTLSEHLLGSADKYLYEAKRSGRNRVCAS